MTIKDDDWGDPLITKEGPEVLGIMTGEQFDAIVKATKEITAIVAAEVEKSRCGILRYQI